MISPCPVVVEASDPIRGEVSLDDWLEQLTVIHQHQRHAFDARNSAAQDVEAQWSTRVSLVTAVEENSALEFQLASKLSEVEEQGRAAAAALSESVSERAVAEEDLGKLASAKDRLTHHGAILLTTLNDAGLLAGTPQTLGSLSEVLFEAHWTTVDRQARRRDLAAFKASLEHSAINKERLDLINAEIARQASERISEDALAALRNDAVNADAWVRRARSALDAIAGPIERLQAAARDLFEHVHHDASKCPACAHDWGNAAALRAAIDSAVSGAPAVVATARAEVERASATSREIHIRLNAALSVEAAIVALQEERATLVAGFEQRNRDMAEFGISNDHTLEELAEAEARLDIADAYAALIAAHDNLMPSLPGATETLLPPDIAVSGLLDQLRAAFEARAQIVHLRLATLAKSIETATATRDRLRTTHAGIQQRLIECRETLRDKGAKLASLRATWEAAAPNTDWSDAALAALKKGLGDEARRLQSAEAHIQAARTAWAAESRRERLSSLRKAIGPALEQQERMTAQIAAANRARAVFQKAAAASSKQVQDLSSVVNPLFARMHANRIVDHINLGDGSNILRWLAQAGSEQLDPGKEFSQGQRQDLALALFLARARSLGGTFFLDEPVIHLDDLNRVGMLDILRAIVLENSNSLNLVITTSSRALARHLIEKFVNVGAIETPSGLSSPLRVIELDGNGRSGITIKRIYPFE